jgi:hypothetical protein
VVDPNPPIVVGTPGLNTQDIVFQLTMLGVGIDVFFRIWLPGFPPRDEWERPADLIISFLVITIVDAAVTSKIHLRRIEIEPIGVTFVFLFRSERARWSELRPSASRARLGDWGVYRTWVGRAGKVRARDIPLTLKQSRAILAFPGRLRWAIPTPVAFSLGFPPKEG